MEKIKLMQGDCLELMKDIPDKSIDLVLTDPPYGTTACKWDSVIPFEPMWEELRRIKKAGVAVILFGSEPFSSYLRLSNLNEFKYDLVWDKGKGTSPGVAKYRPMPSFENVLVFGNGRVNYFPIMREGEPYTRSNTPPSQDENAHKFGYRKHICRSEGGRFPLSVVSFPTSNKDRGLHPTQKPVALLEYLIKTYTNEGDTVLDFTMGSGSTGVACVNTNRRFIGIELDETYFNIAKERIYANERVTESD